MHGVCAAAGAPTPHQWRGGLGGLGVARRQARHVHAVAAAAPRLGRRVHPGLPARGVVCGGQRQLGRKGRGGRSSRSSAGRGGCCRRGRVRLSLARPASLWHVALGLLLPLHQRQVQVVLLQLELLGGAAVEGGCMQSRARLNRACDRRPARPRHPSCPSCPGSQHPRSHRKQVVLCVRAGGRGGDAAQAHQPCALGLAAGRACAAAPQCRSQARVRLAQPACARVGGGGWGRGAGESWRRAKTQGCPSPVPATCAPSSRSIAVGCEGRGAVPAKGKGGGAGRAAGEEEARRRQRMREALDDARAPRRLPSCAPLAAAPPISRHAGPEGAVRHAPGAAHGPGGRTAAPDHLH